MRALSDSAAPSAPTPPRAQDTPRRARILILTGDVDGNLGDRAILQGTCLALREIRPDCEIVVVSASDAAHLGIEARVIPRGPRGLLQLCAAAARSDLVLCGGGGLFQDDDSLVKMPYWAARVWLARALCRRVIGYSLGVGPLDAVPSRWAARLAFAAMERVSVRDPAAQETARALTRKQVSLVPDPAILAPATPVEETRRWLAQQGVPSEGAPLIGVAVRRWFPPRPRFVPNHVRSRFRRSPPRLSAESQHLASLIARALDDVVAASGARIVFLPSYRAPHEGDVLLCHEIAGRMRRTQAPVLEIDDSSLYKGVTSQLALLVGGRMHPTILAASVGTPMVGVAYNQKFHGFFRLMNRSERLLDVAELVEGERVDLLSDLILAALEDSDRVADRTTELARVLRAFIEDILRDVP